MIDGPQRKLDWAYKHLQHFNAEWKSFLKGEPYKATPYIDSQTGQELLRIKVNKRPTSDLSLTFGDFVQNLRASLDHLVWDIALSDKNTPAPDDSTEFPIFIMENAEAIRKRIKCLPQPVRDAIKGLQPYTAGDRRREHPLWIVRQLSNADKHKRIPIVANEVTFLAGTREQPHLSGMTIRGRFEDEHVLPWPSFPSRTEPDVKEQAILSFAIEIDDIMPLSLPIDLVDGLYDFVRNKVFGELTKLIPE